LEYLILRSLCATATGMILSQTGSLIQMSTRNILASPSTLGFDGLSILWVLILHSLLLIFGFDYPPLWTYLLGVPVFIIIGHVFSKVIGKYQHIERLILIGLTFNLMVGAVFSLWQFLFLAFNLPFPVELWFGHFRHAEFSFALVLIIFELCFLSLWIMFQKDFLIFSLGKGIAANLKLKEKRLYSMLFIIISVGTFSVVTLFGAFSFLGLIFPLMARKMWFRKFDLNGEFFWGALVNGLAFMLIDLACYFLPIMGAEIPVGLIATAVGAVSLILLLWKSNDTLEILAKKQK